VLDRHDRDGALLGDSTAPAYPSGPVDAAEAPLSRLSPIDGAEL
jgi:hypothetical protein